MNDTVIERWTFPGNMQWAMTVDDQRQHGLIARESKSIRPRNHKKAQPITRIKKQEIN